MPGIKGQKRSLNSEECTGALTAVGDALYVIGGKWKLRIIVGLSEGNKRFNDLQRKVHGISARVLSNELKDLEENGFIVRKVHSQATPVIVEYELTDYADTLSEVLAALQSWGAMHRENIRNKAKKELEAKAVTAAA